MRWADLDLSTATWTIPAADTKGERSITSRFPRPPWKPWRRFLA
jgi:hypothetical protein